MTDLSDYALEAADYYFRSGVAERFYRDVIVPHFDCLTPEQKRCALDGVHLIFFEQKELIAKIEARYGIKLPEFGPNQTPQDILEWLMENCDTNRL